MTKIKFTIRPAKLADCPACEALGHVPEIAIAPDWFLPLEYYQQVVRGKHIFLVAEVNGQIVGFTIGEKIVAGILGQYIVVEKKYRRHGIGVALIKATENEARKRKAYFVLAYAVAKSAGIQRAFKILGYRRGQLTYEWMKGLTPRPRPGRFGAPK
jgi:GNAT superfamily N-acetyltransferase